MAHLGCATKIELLRKLHVDFVVDLAPRYVGPAIPTGYDVWGMGYRDVPYPGGVYAETIDRPLAKYQTVEAISAIMFGPTPTGGITPARPSRCAALKTTPSAAAAANP
jgi:hypothetical protein